MEKVVIAGSAKIKSRLLVKVLFWEWKALNIRLSKENWRV